MYDNLNSLDQVNYDIRKLYINKLNSDIALQLRSCITEWVFNSGNTAIYDLVARAVSSSPILKVLN